MGGTLTVEPWYSALAARIKPANTKVKVPENWTDLKETFIFCWVQEEPRTHCVLHMSVIVQIFTKTYNVSPWLHSYGHRHNDIYKFPRRFPEPQLVPELQIMKLGGLCGPETESQNTGPKSITGAHVRMDEEGGHWATRWGRGNVLTGLYFVFIMYYCCCIICFCFY